jgi:O-antigen/teichoic acid export membrane protein
LRIARAATLVSAPATLGLALVYPVAESIVFGGKWADAAIPLAVLAIGYVARSSFISVPNPLLLARNAFKEWAIAWGGNCAGVLLFATLGAIAASRVPAGMLAGSALALEQWQMLIVSLAVSGFLVIGCWYTTAKVMRTIGVSFHDTLRACIGILPLVAAITAACAVFDHFVLVPRLETIFPQYILVARRSVAISDLIRAPVLGLFFAAAMAVGLRFLARAQVADALGVLPGKLARPIQRLLRL